jgi:hypothetical protein
LSETQVSGRPRQRAKGIVDISKAMGLSRA